MEAADRELLLKTMARDVRLKRLYAEHQKLEDRLAFFKCRPFLTALEERQEKEIKLRKLAGVDRMMAILNQYRSAA